MTSDFPGDLQNVHPRLLSGSPLCAGFPGGMTLFWRDLYDNATPNSRLPLKEPRKFWGTIFRNNGMCQGLRSLEIFQISTIAGESHWPPILNFLYYLSSERKFSSVPGKKQPASGISESSKKDYLKKNWSMSLPSSTLPLALNLPKESIRLDNSTTPLKK